MHRGEGEGGEKKREERGEEEAGDVCNSLHPLKKEAYKFPIPTIY